MKTRRGKRPTRRLARGVRKAIEIDRRERERQAGMVRAFRDFAAMYGLSLEGPLKPTHLCQLARLHERRADAHHMAAALLRELAAAPFNKTLMPVLHHRRRPAAD